jgi:hypothetical protein
LNSFELLFIEEHRDGSIIKMPTIVTERQILESSSELVEAALAMGVLCAADNKIMF